MPTYVYETIPQEPSAPVRRFDYVQRMADDPLTTHPETGEPVRRVITGGMGFLSGKTQPDVPVCPSTGMACQQGCGI